MENERPIGRRISLEDDFMNFKTNDLLYGFMRGLSTAKPEAEEKGKWREYLTKKEFQKNKKLIAAICGVTMKTIGRNLESLMEAGLVEEGWETLNKTEIEVYWFPYDYNGNYKIVDQKIVKYLVDTRNSQAIRVYLFLLNKYEWKENYIFTIKEIKKALGYAESTKSADSMIRNILASFKQEGLIKYNKIYELSDVGGSNSVKEVPVERMELKYVICAGADLPNF